MRSAGNLPSFWSGFAGMVGGNRDTVRSVITMGLEAERRRAGIDYPRGRPRDFGPNQVRSETDSEGETRIDAEGVFVTVGARLGRLVEEKQSAYGNATVRAAECLRVLFPEGIPPEKYSDAVIMIQVLNKLSRIAAGSEGEENPWEDLAGYGILAVGLRHGS